MGTVDDQSSSMKCREHTYIGSEDGKGLAGVLSGSCRYSCDVSAWAVGNGQSGGLSNSVRLRALDDSCWHRAVGSQSGNGLRGGDPDRRIPGSIIARWGDVSVRNSCAGWLGRADDIGAWLYLLVIG